MKKYITVLDYTNSRVFQYKVKLNTHALNFLKHKGFVLANIEWMEHRTGNLINN